MSKINSDLNLYNTADRTVSKFVPLNPGKVGIYLCGATVQAPPHIGHIRSGVNFDILRRWLTAIGYDVTFVRNVTDIDDKILHKAVHEEIPWWAVAMKYERAFSDAYAALNVMPPTYEPRATGHITQMISLMEKLIANGSAYAPGNGDVYLEVRKLKSYLTLSNQKLDDLQSADDADLTYKKDPRDFALWKAAKPGDPSWPTPWGDGRPGWHLECSAMAHAYLGEAFDIHGGGLDLIFPHHENEIAQSQSAGWEFSKIWMHNAWVTTSGEKMSKSLGNSLQVMEILKKVRGIELRWYLGSAHYRSMLEFSFEALEESAVNFRRIEGFLQRAKGLLKSDIQPSISAQFAAAMNNDLAVPQALADISEQVRIGNTAITENDLTALSKSASEVRGALEILGCDPFDPIFADSSNSKSEILDGLISLALEQRTAARARKDFAASDAIRDSLTALGITIEDTPTGSRWTVN
ncbi:MAG: cysteine--tRNA ligase [Actinobacteria bacterium]|uniref:Cysteine--tRNA ligase n=1 Tax=freshwater metagenome TaxID=449393 RepID=A0A6J6S523_9ZZZZ|nr:cysteine--tRNA ligase [Actinomycetota bacterium]